MSPVLFFVSDEGEQHAYLQCDECGTARPAGGLTVAGELHGCSRLGAFRMVTSSAVLLLSSPPTA